ncbi:hypothetical protein B296_00036604 [Ensete ventricosum]|uniref:Uncharacterized protein n=1 Tax=Ensete ventricosum TaxID=4639 RepID=A0A427A0A7_ENSVE|nr:hypothetical protein B296_00036604 [Ensete ventricosum]
MLRAANEELKLGANQDLVVTVEHRAKELEETMEKLWIELESLKNHGGRLQGILRVHVRPREDGVVSYEFGYQVAVERLQGKHPQIEVEQDSFVECPEDDNCEDGSQPSFRRQHPLGEVADSVIAFLLVFKCASALCSSSILRFSLRPAFDTSDAKFSILKVVKTTSGGRTTSVPKARL